MLTEAQADVLGSIKRTPMGIRRLQVDTGRDLEEVEATVGTLRALGLVRPARGRHAAQTATLCLTPQGRVAHETGEVPAGRPARAPYGSRAADVIQAVSRFPDTGTTILQVAHLCGITYGHASKTLYVLARQGRLTVRGRPHHRRWFPSAPAGWPSGGAPAAAPLEEAEVVAWLASDPAAAARVMAAVRHVWNTHPAADAPTARRTSAVTATRERGVGQVAADPRGGAR